VLTGNWTQEEEATLVAKVREIGPRWAAIAQIFPGRTDIGVKNHYISITGKQNREFAAGTAGGAAPASTGATFVPGELAE
jgi:hypothetical protein